MPTEPEFDTLVGTIVGAHGLQGALKVRLATPHALSMIGPPRRPESMPKPMVQVWIGKSAVEGSIRDVISAKKPAAKGPVIVRLADCADRNSADAYYGLSIFVPASRREPLDEGDYFVEDLIGLEAVTDTGVMLGVVTEILQSPANDVYQTDQGALIPAVKDYVLNIDLNGRRITVRNDPGLWPQTKPVRHSSQKESVPLKPES